MASRFEVIASHVDGLAQRTLNHAQKLVNMMNFFNPDSELSQLNKAAKNQWHPVSDTLFKVLCIAKQLQLESKGVFRVDFEGISKKPNGQHGFSLKKHNQVKLKTDTILNLGGIGKGFIVDEAFEFAAQNGGQDILINAGGDIRAKSTSHPWKIALLNPYKKDVAFGRIDVKNGAVVTSGTYAKTRTENGKNHTHFFNSKTKQFIEFL